MPPLRVLSVAYTSAIRVVLYDGDDWFGDHWLARSDWAIVFKTLLGTLASLFILWSLYLLVRFAVAFGKARRVMKRKWENDDRAIVDEAARGESLNASPIPGDSR